MKDERNAEMLNTPDNSPRPRNKQKLAESSRLQPAEATSGRCRIGSASDAHSDAVSVSSSGASSTSSPCKDSGKGSTGSSTLSHGKGGGFMTLGYKTKLKKIHRKVANIMFKGEAGYVLFYLSQSSRGAMDPSRFWCGFTARMSRIWLCGF